MISRPLSRVTNSTEVFLAPGQTVTAEGQAMVYSPGSSANGVIVGTGAANEAFAGFVFAGTSAYVFPEGTATKSETVLVGAAGSVTLAEKPLSAAAVSIYDLTAGTFPTVTLDTDGQTVTGLTGGDTVKIVYTYNLTVVQAQALYGTVQPGGYAGQIVDQVGIATRGFIATSEFNTGLNWALAGSDATHAIVVGANGVLTMGSNTGSAGAVVPGQVTRLPDDFYPFLGISFNSQNA